MKKLILWMTIVSSLGVARVSFASADIKVVNAFLDALAKMDLQKVGTFLDAEIEQEYPFAPAHWPMHLRGRHQVLDVYALMPHYFSRIQYSDRHLERLASNHGVLAEFKGSMKFKSGATYENKYVAVYFLKAGKIVRIREYYDSMLAEKGFASAGP